MYALVNETAGSGAAYDDDCEIKSIIYLLLIIIYSLMIQILIWDLRGGKAQSKLTDSLNMMDKLMYKLMDN